jgi:hypothetical protein
MPKYINLDEIEEGMVVAKDIKNDFGQTMVKAGVVITKQHIPTLNNWTVEGIFIKQAEDEIQQSEESIKENMKVLLQKMGWKPENQLEIDMLKAASIQRGINGDR